MLDEEDPSLSSVSSDSNTYTLGRIEQHHVVLASLPADTTGNSAAATVATNLLRSFPKIRFALVVGIGGGAPSEPNRDLTKDVSLGDMVVSNLDGEHGKAAFLQFYQSATYRSCRWRNTV